MLKREMESGFTREYGALVNELTQGLEKANQLELHLGSSASPSEGFKLLLQMILSNYDKALMILNSMGSDGPGSSVSAARSLETKELENGQERPADGYSWRKYGRKEILGAKYPRNYYRCTYHKAHCKATKKVQKSDDDPAVFDITYKGMHMCKQMATTFPQNAPAEKQELEHNLQKEQVQMQNGTVRFITESMNSDEMIQQFSFPSSMHTCQEKGDHCFPTFDLDEVNQWGACPSLFFSPETSEYNYFSPPTYQIKNLHGTYQQSESDIAEIIPADAPTANSSISGMNFLIDQMDFDPTSLIPWDFSNHNDFL